MFRSNSALKKYKIIVLLILLITGFKARAQFSDSTHYHIAASSTGSINRTDDGNAYLITNSLNLAVKKKDYRFNLNGNYVYGKQNNALTNRDLTTLLNADLFKYAPFEHSFYWALVDYNTSFSLKINNQSQGGLGFAYNIFDTKNARLNVSDGVIYDQSDLMVHDTIHDAYHTWRNSFRLAFHFDFNGIIVFDGSNFFQSSFQRGSDYIIRSNNSLTFKVRKWLGLTTALAYNKMNRTGSDNLLFTYGLTIDQYF